MYRARTIWCDVYWDIERGYFDTSSPTRMYTDYNKEYALFTLIDNAYTMHYTVFSGGMVS